MNLNNRLVGIAARRVGTIVFRNVKRKSGFLRCAVALAVFLEMIAWGALPALGAPNPGDLPTGGKIVSGQGSISVNGAQMTVIQQQSKMIANWDTFNIGRNAGVTFIQPSASSSALNRIFDQNPSQIFGSLSANGRVFLLNPSGIIFGPTAQVNVGSIVASSLNLSNSDFLAGNYRFTNSGSAGGIINRGSINTSDYGVVALIAPQVTNSGTINTPKGSVGLAAGNRVSLDFAGDGLIKVSVDEAALNAAIENSGAAKAEGGQVFMTAKAAGDLTATVVNNSGIIEADTITEKNGVIVLDGGDKGIVSNSGAISAKGKNSGETGGTVTVSGDNVALYAGSAIDASAPSGGGTVNIGGGRQGSDPNIRNAGEVYMDPKAGINADATLKGEGGSVVLWSEKSTNFQGSISAKGGPQGGNGGKVETSSRKVLDASGSVSTLALKGNGGNWLLDPSDITISDTDPGGGVSWVTPSSILTGLSTGDVTIETHSGAGGTGDITVTSPINTTYDFYSARTLTLQADREIVMTAGIDATTGGNLSPLNVILWSNYAGGGGAITMNTGSQIKSNGGDITLGGGPGTVIGPAQGGGTSPNSYGIALTNAVLNSGTGGISLYGLSSSAPSPSVVMNNTTISSTGGDISITGDRMLLSGSVQTSGNLTLSVDVPSVSVNAGGLAVTAGGLLLQGAGGDYLLNNSGNNVGTLAANTGVINFKNSGALTIGSVGGIDGITTTSTTTVQAGGNIALDQKITAGPSGTAITLATSGNFINNYGAGALDPLGGWWLIYSSDPRLDTRNGLVADFIQYNAPYATTAAVTGKGFLYSLAPIINVSLTGDVSKTYDRTLDATLDPANHYTSSGTVGSDIVNLSLPTSGTYNDKYAGTSKKVSVAGIGIVDATDGSGTPVYGYQLGSTSISGSVGTITPVNLSVTGATAQNKVYNANTDAVISGESLVGVLSGDTVSIGGGGFFLDKNVGSGKAVTASLVLSGADSGGYTLSQPTGLTADITAASLTVTGAAAQNKVYNANTDAFISGESLVGVFSGDTVSVGGAGFFSDKNVGTGKAVTASLVLSGADSGNYTLSQPTALTADITAASLTVTGAAAQNKVYNANADAVISGESLVGVFSEDTVNVGGGGFFMDKNVGSGKAVTASLVLSGVDSGNYTLSQPTGLTADITAASLTVTGAAAQNKVYDANADAVISGESLGGVFSGDIVSISGSGYFSDKNVGTGKTVTASFVLGGADSNNYTLSQPTGFTADITPASLIIAASSDTKTYDTTTVSNATPTVSGLQGGDSVSGLGQVFDSKNAGNRTLLLNGFTINDGNGGNNYAVSTATAGGVINPDPITVAADSATKQVGSADPALTYTITYGQLLGADGLTGSLTRLSGESVGVYPIELGTLGNSNYLITFIGADFTITPASISSDYNLIQSIQSSLTSSQTYQNGTDTNTVLNTIFANQETTGNGPSMLTSIPSGGGTSAGGGFPTLTAVEYQQLGTAAQNRGEFKTAAINFHQGANVFLLNGSVPEGRQAFENCVMAELQDYFNYAGIGGFQGQGGGQGMRDMDSFPESAGNSSTGQTLTRGGGPAGPTWRKTSLDDLPRDTAVVYTLIFPDRLELIVGFRSGLKRVPIPIDAAALSQDINALRASLQRRTRWDYLPESQKLYQLLVKPIELELRIHGIETIVFIPDGALRTLPFATLHDGNRFLIEKYSVSVTPGLDLTDPRPRWRKDAKVLSAGLTESVQGFAPLVNVKQELDGIQGLYGADRLENTTFSEMKVTQSMRENPYSIVHMATHGSFASTGSDTFLLAWDGKIGMNQLGKLMERPGSGGGRVELLCLSACETAAGDDKAALGLAGVAVRAGARSALATLWSVSDQAASELVLEFYRQFKNPAVTKAASLREAQLKLLDDPRYRHPYYWSPFLLIGNWM